jgi:hypothetical protein
MLFIVSLPLSAQTKTKAEIEREFQPKPWTEEDALKYLDRDKNSHYDPNTGMFLFPGGRIATENIYDDLLYASKVAAEVKSDRIIQAIVDFPVPAEEPYIGEAKMMALAGSKDNPAAHQCVIDALENPEPVVQKAAAGILFGWGEWDLAVPVIHKYGNYDVIRYQEDPRVIPILQEGARSSTWEGRTLAACYLQFFGDSSMIVDVARDVVAHAPIDVDDNSVARAKYTALRELARHGIANNISDIARLANDRNTLVRITVVDMLELFAYNGVEEAYDALKKISEENADPNLRGTAKVALDNIDSHRREK